jgi:Domain of unknown function (DUF1883)
LNFLHYELRLKKGDLVEVQLDKQAHVQLLDEINFTNYKKGKKHNAIGGLSKDLLVKLSSPYKGLWHLVVDLGGHAGTVRASVKVIKS